MTKKANNNDKVEYNGEKVQLKYTMYALHKLEQHGINIMNMKDKELGAGDIGTLLWAGLLWKFPSLSIDEVLMNFELNQVQQIAEAISAAFANIRK